MNWKRYAVVMLLFNLAGLLLLYAFLRLQQFLPLNPQGLPAVSPDLSFNTADQFLDQHQLAKLQRRDHDELFYPDAGAGSP